MIRDSNNQIVRIDSLFINIANQHLRGLDLEARYTTDVAGGDLTLRLLATQILEDSQLFLLPLEARKEPLERLRGAFSRIVP